MAVTGHAIADDLSIQHAERRKEGGRTVALVVMGLTRRNSGTQREQRLRSVQRLNLALLVNTQYQRFVRWIQIQPNDVMQLFDKPLVPAQLERFDPMRLQTMLFPDSVDSGLTQSLSF